MPPPTTGPDCPGDGRFASVEALLATAIDGETSPAELRELNEALRASPAARQHVLRLLHQEALMEFELRTDETAQQVVQVGPARAATYGRRAPRASGGNAAWISVAAGIVFLAAFAVLMTTVRTDKPAPVVRMAVDLYSQFAEGYGPVEDVFPTGGEYRLTEGAVVLDIPRGVDLTVEAPATFVIDSISRMTLESGRVSARVSYWGVGFVVSTAQGDIVDLGTEFGVVVESDKQSEIHVFDGEVELHAGERDEGEVLKNITGGSAVAWEDGEIRDLPCDAGAFIDLRDLGPVRWELYTQRLLRDPDLACHYAFAPDADHPARLTEGSGRGGHGRIAGAAWDTGRWQDKGALRFANLDDRVGFDLPFDSASATLAFWVNVDRVEYPIATILNTDGWRGRAHHFQVLPNGAVAGAVRSLTDGGETSTSRGGLVRMGVWTHLAAVIDSRRGKMIYYVNGERALVAGYRPEGALELGPAHLGYWNKPDDNEPRRDFRGRIDEMVVLRRPMNPAEIKEMYQAGKPF